MKLWVRFYAGLALMLGCIACALWGATWPGWAFIVVTVVALAATRWTLRAADQLDGRRHVS